jgi:hypothetical protein
MEHLVDKLIKDLDDIGKICIQVFFSVKENEITNIM